MLLISLPLRATHIIGGEISYQCLGNNKYKIALDVFRDCYYGQAPFDAPAHISIFNDAGVFVNNINVAPLYTEIIPNNISNDPCLFPPPTICVEHARYEGTVTLNQSGGFYFVYQRCCRNETISNVVSPDSTGATYYIYLSPESRALCNDSPSFTNSATTITTTPPVFVCVNKPFSHSYTAFDKEGDSLVYKFYTPFKGASITAPQPPFASPPKTTNPHYQSYDTLVLKAPLYNLNQLLGPSSVATLEVDHHTGLLTAYPQISGQFVVGVMVEEFRNGQLLSVLRREFQYNVGDCAELDVQIGAPDAQCDDLTVHFKNNTDVAQNFIWYFDWPNLTPSYTGFEPVYTFPDTGTYTVVLIAEPVGLCVDTGFHQIFLQYNSLTADFSFQTYDCTTESVLVLHDLSADPVSPPVWWSWQVIYDTTTLTSNQQNPVFEIPNPASGVITLTVRSENGCEQTKILNFVAGGNDPTAVLADTLKICTGESVQLNPNAITEGFTYKWSPNMPAGQQHLPNPVVAPLQTTTYSVTITGYNALCTSTAKVTVQVFPPVSLKFQAVTDCDAHLVHFTNQSQNAFSGYVWDFGDPSTLLDVSTQANPSYTYPEYGSYLVTLMTAPNAVCKDTIQKQIEVSEKILEAAFDYQYTTCEEDAVTIRFFDQTNNNLANTTSWKWTFSGVYSGTSTQKNPVIVVTQEGGLFVVLEVTTSEGCVAATAPDTLHIDLTELPGIPSGGEVLGCLSSGIVLNAGGDPSYLYHWSPAEGLSCTDCPSPLANPSQTTSYTVLVQNVSADTCDITRQVEVFVPQDIGLVASDDVLTCAPTASLTANTTLLPVVYAWFDGNGSQVAANLNHLTVDVTGYNFYTVRATDQFGCHYYDTVNVVGGPVNIEAAGDQIICSDQPLNVYAANLDSNDTLSWQWTPTSAFEGPVDLPNPNVIPVTGDQWLYISATNQFGCTGQDSVYVAVVDVNNELDFSYIVECNGSEVSFVNQSTGAYNFSWNFGDSTTTDDVSLLDNPTYAYPGPGTYLVSLTMNFPLPECIDTVYREVKIEETQFAVDFTYEYLGCDVDSIQMQFHDATTIFQDNIDITCWHWETSNGDVSDLPSPVFTVYNGHELIVTLTVCTSNDCMSSKTKTIKLEFIEVNFADTIVLCQGDSVFLNPLGNPTHGYHWFPAVDISDPDIANPQVWPTQTTTYSVEITNFLPDTCSITRTVTVFVPEKIEVTTSDDTLTCGDSVTLVASSNVSPVNFQWVTSLGGAVGNQPLLTILPNTDTEYKVRGTDQYGCADSAYVFVANESVKINWPVLGTKCPENEIPLTVANQVADHEMTYDWAASAPGQILPPVTGPSVTLLTPPAGQSATYSVTATNQYGCSKTLTQSINSHNFVPTVVDSLKLCAGDSQPINPGANPELNYAWSPPEGLSNPNVPNPVVTALQTTIYTVSVFDNFGPEVCEEVIGVTVFVPPVIELQTTPDTFTCGSAIVISAQANLPLSLEWFEEPNISLGTGSTLQVNPETATTYTVVATDSYECTASAEVAVANNQLDIVLDGANGVIDTCPMEAYKICITNLDPNDVLTFEWEASQGGTLLDGANTDCPTVTTEQGVTSTFTAQVSNQWGCTSSEAFSVTTYTFAPVIRNFITICPGVPTPINPGSEPTNLSYKWSPQTGLSCYDCPNPEATLYDKQLYTVTIQGYNPKDTCSLTQTVQVQTTPPIGLAAIPSDTAICDPVDIAITTQTSSGIVTSYTWSENPDFSEPFSTGSQVTVKPHATQNYYVMATDTLGCTDTAVATVFAYPIDVTLPDRYNFCAEEAPLTITVENNAPGQELFFEWTPMEYIEQIISNGIIVVVDIPDTTVFTAYVQNFPYGCKDTISTTVYYYDIEPTVNAEIFSSEDTIIYNSGEYSQLEINYVPGYSYLWTPEEGLDDPTLHNPIAMPGETTTYTVVVTDEGDCQATREVTIVVINPDCDEPYIFLPTAFSPNSDGRNDVLYVRSNIVDEVELAIYNRWGQQVFLTKDKNVGWDGTFKGELQTPDVYGYYLKAKCFNGQEFFKKGNVTLLR